MLAEIFSEVFPALISALLVTISLSIRVHLGSISRAGGDLAFCAVAVEAGYLVADLKLQSFVYLATDLVLFLAFFLTWTILLHALKVDEECQSCGQSFIPSKTRTQLCIIIGYVLVVGVMVVRLFQEGILSLE